MYFVLWNVLFCFHLSHWEKYNTGVMYLPWGYDLSMVGGTVLYALTSIFGYQAWKVKLPGGIQPGPILEFCLYAGSMGLALPVALRNTYSSYRDGTGKMRPFWEAVRPMASFLIAMTLFLAWATGSSNRILEADPRLFFYASGTLCANISCRLIVSQMSNTRCELINVLLIPLAAVVAFSLCLPGLTSTTELNLLYCLSALLTICHLHYGLCVVLEMSRHLRISPFSIRDRGDVRLISSKSTDATSDVASSDDDDDELAVDINDLEVIVASNTSLTGSAASGGSHKLPAAAVLQV